MYLPQDISKKICHMHALPVCYCLSPKTCFFQVGGVRVGSVSVSHNLVRMEVPAQFPAAQHWDTPAPVSL